MLFRTSRYGHEVTSFDILKSMALWVMVIDHLGGFFFQDVLLLRAYGRICVPIWLVLAGYGKPSRVDPWLLFFAGALTVIDAVLYYPIFPVNILVSILLARFFVGWIAKHSAYDHFYVWLFLLFTWNIALGRVFEYGGTALLLAYAGYRLRLGDADRSRLIMLVSTGAVFLFYQSFGFGFNWVENLVMFTGVGAVLWYFWRMKPTEYELHWPPFNWVLRFCGRNTLWLYFAHYVLFQLICLVLFPERYTEFQWFNQ